MQRSLHPSPRSRVTSQNKMQCVNEDASLVLDLQQKLINLEAKYSRFVEKCTNLLKSSQFAPKPSFKSLKGSSTCRSSSGRTHPLVDPTAPQFRSKSSAAKSIENGKFLLEVMGQISDIVLKLQENLNKPAQNIEYFKKKLNEGLNSMLGEIWEILFENETSVQDMLRVCNTKAIESNTNQSLSSKNLYRDLQKSKQKGQYYKNKYKSSLEKVDFLTKNLSDQHECLQRIKSDHQKLREKLLHRDKAPMPLSARPSSENFTILDTRSPTGSPLPQCEEIEDLRTKNSELSIKIVNLLHQNSILQQHYRKPSSCVDFRLDTYEIEKLEIQEQLKALQNKLTGFEKIAKTLIDTSIRTELSILDKKREPGPRQRRNGEIESPELSLMNSHCSLLEADQVQKSLESLEKEKRALEKELQNERLEKRQVGAVHKEMEKKVEELEEECRGLRKIGQEKERNIESLKGDLQRIMERNEDYKEEVGEWEKEMIKSASARELEEQKAINTYLEKNLGSKIEEVKENENIIESLTYSNKIFSEKNKEFKTIMQENREEMNKLVKLNSKQSKTISSLETAFENLQLRNSSLESELENFTRQVPEIYNPTNEIKQLNQENQNLVEKIKKLEEEISYSSIKEKKCEESLKELEKEFNQAIIQLEETRKDLMTVRIETEDYQQKMEDLLANKNEIIASYESDNTQIPELALELIAKKESYFSLEREYMNKSKELEELTNSRNELKDQISLSSVKINEAMMKISELNDNKAKLIADRSEILNENLNLKSKVKDLNDTLSQLEIIAEKTKEKENNINIELVHARKNIFALEEENKSIKEYNQNSQGSQAKMNKQISEYKTTIDVLTENLDKKCTEMELLNSQIDDFLSKKQENKETRSKLKETVAINKQLQDSFDQKNKQATDMEQKLRKKLEEIEFMSKKLSESRQENGAILKEIEWYKRKESENKEEIQRLAQNLEEACKMENGELKSIKQKNRDLFDEIQHYKQKELLLAKENQIISSQLEEITTREKDLLRSVEEDHKITDNEIKKYKLQELASLKENQRIKEYYEGIISIKLKEIVKIEDTNRRLLETIENQNKIDLANRQENLKIQNDLESVIESLKYSLKLLEEKNSKFSKDLEDNKQKELANIKENQRITEYFERIINSQSEKLKVIEREAGKVPVLQQKVSDLVHQTYKIEEEIALRDKDIKILTDKLQTIHNENQESLIRKENKETATKDLLLQVKKLNEGIAELADSNINLRGAIAQLESDNKLLTESSISKRKSTKICIDRYLSSTKSSLDEIKAEFSMYVSMFNHFAPSFNKIRIYINDYQNQLKNNKSKIDELTRNILLLKETNNKLIQSPKPYQDEKEVPKVKEQKNKLLEELMLENTALKGQILSEEVKSSKLIYKEKQYNEWKAGIEKELLRREKKIIELTVEISKNDKNIEDNQLFADQANQLSKMTQKIAEMENQLLDLNELRRKININKQEFLQLDTLNQVLQQKIQEKNKLIENISSSKAQLQNEVAKLNKDLTFQKEINLSLATGTNPLKEKSDKLELEVDSLKSALSSQKSQSSDLQQILAAKESTELEMKLLLLEKNEELQKLKIEFSNKIKNPLPASESGRQMSIDTARSDQNPEPPKRLKVGDSLLVPTVARGKNNSECIREEKSGSKAGSEYIEGFNITSGKIVKKVTAGNKHWVLFQTETGSFSWKDEAELQFSVASELEEEVEDIKIALGEWYTGSIIQAIGRLKQVTRNEISFEMHQEFCYPEAKQIELETNSFRGEMLQEGLEISIIDSKSDECEDSESLKAIIASKDAKLEKRKRTLVLHKEQILVLKEQIRKYNEEIIGYQINIKEFEGKLQSIMATDVQYIKQVFGNLVLKMKIDKNTEDLITLLFKILDFHTEEIDKIQQQRKGNKKLIKSKKS